MICELPGCGEHYACLMRSKGVLIAPSATPSSANWRKKAVDPPSWEKGIVYEDRPNGTKMPVLKECGEPLRVKEAAERRHDLTRFRQQRAAASNRSVTT